MSDIKLWVRNMFTGLCGGMYTDPDENPYMVAHPPRPLFVKELWKIGIIRETQIIEKMLMKIG